MTTANDLLPQGSVISYPYLWAAQRDSGEIEGRKPRPVCLVLKIRDPERAIHHLVLLAITSRQPARDRAALEIPETERRRAGLTRYSHAWVIVDEYNYDIAEQSYYLEPGAKIGEFSATFLRAVAKALRATLTKIAVRVDRTMYLRAANVLQAQLGAIASPTRRRAIEREPPRRQIAKKEG